MEIKMAVKYVFVTGGVGSGLGKGITAASLGRLLKMRGYKVTMQKFDPHGTALRPTKICNLPVLHSSLKVYQSFFLLSLHM